MRVAAPPDLSNAVPPNTSKIDKMVLPNHFQVDYRTAYRQSFLLIIYYIPRGTSGIDDKGKTKRDDVSMSRIPNN